MTRAVRRGLSAWALILSLGLAGHAWALVNTSELLIIDPGDEFKTVGSIYRSVSIVVHEGGKLNVAPDSTTDDTQGWIRLIAPYMFIQGEVRADKVSMIKSGQGGPAGSGYSAMGAGGAGHGGTGGDGYMNADSGGKAYENLHSADKGSCSGEYPSHFNTTVNPGGGSIRLDALQLEMDRGVVSASGKDSGGSKEATTYQAGGSGGCIFINVQDLKVKGGDFLVTGEDGGNGDALRPHCAGGGGGGGLVKAYKYVTQHDFYVNEVLKGGSGGRDFELGGFASDGKEGTHLTQDPPPLPSAPLLISPTMGQNTGQQPTFMFFGTDVLDSQFLRYALEISTDAGFSSTVLSTNQFLSDPGWNQVPYYASGAVASYTPATPLPLSNTFYWRVRVTNEGNSYTSWSAYSGAWSFHTNNNQKPTVPVLVFPSAGQTHVSKNPQFKVLGADPDGNTLTFAIYISTNAKLQNGSVFQDTYPGWDKSEYPTVVAYRGVTATCQLLNTGSYQDTLIPGTTYYWKVVAIDQFQESRESGIQTFTVTPLPAVPVLDSPSSGQVVTSKRPTLRLHSSSPSSSALKYKLEVSSDGFKTLTVFQSESQNGWTASAYASGESAVFTFPEANTLAPGITYAWRASAYDLDNANSSALSGAATFTVVPPPLLPVLVDIPDRFQAADSNLTFTFSAASESGNTLTYRFELSDTGFQSVLASFVQAQDPSGWSAPYYASNSLAAFSLPTSLDLQRGKTYGWRVAATDGISQGPYSVLRQFSLSDKLEIVQSKMYPNPVVGAGTLTLALQLSVSAEARIRMFNLRGLLVKEWAQSVPGGAQVPLACPIDGFAPGTYICVIELTSPYGNRTLTKRFSVVH